MRRKFSSFIILFLLTLALVVMLGSLLAPPLVPKAQKQSSNFETVEATFSTTIVLPPDILHNFQETKDNLTSAIAKQDNNRFDNQFGTTTYPTYEIIDILWILVCSGLVFLMQAGFMCLESGFTRSKNSINVAIKNLTDFGISVSLFWAFGFALMFGATYKGWIGHTGFFYLRSPNPFWRPSFFSKPCFAALLPLSSLGPLLKE